MSYNLTDVRGELTQPQNNYIILKHRMKRFIYRGVEQLVARRAHNPEVVWFKSHPRNHTWTSAWRTCWRPPFLLNDPYILGVILFACTTYDSVRLPTDRLFCTRMTSALFLRYSTLKIKWCNRDGNSHHYFCRPLLPYLILHSSRFLIEKATDAPCRSTDCQRLGNVLRVDKRPSLRI